MIIEMTTRIEIIEGEAVAGVEIDTPVTGTEIGITAVVARVVATVLMITRSVGETACLLHEEALVVAAVAATVLMITRGVAETAHHLQVGALVAPLLARSHLLLRDLLSGTMMTGLRALGALRHKHNSLAKHLEQLRMNGLALILCVATHLLDGGLFSVKVV